jgi:hypothetical protein
MRPWRRKERVERVPLGTDATAAAALNEFEAFLAGRYIDYLVQHSRAIPTWAWVNAVAHATHDELVAIATGTTYFEALPSAARWQQAVRAIARHLVAETGDDDERLRELQSQVLVPVELTLAQEWDRPLNPAKIRDIVLWALASRPGG